MDHPVLISTRQLLLNQNWGFAGVDVSWMWEIQLICVKSEYFLHMLHLQTCWTTEWERWHLWRFMMFGCCLIYIWCSNNLFWSADFLLGQSSAQKRTKRYTHEQTWNPEKKQKTSKLTIHFLGSILNGFRFEWVFPFPHPWAPYPWTLAVPSGTRHGCHLTPPCGFTHTGGVGVKQPRDPLKGTKGETKTTGIITLPSRELTYFPPWEKENHLLKSDFDGIC